MSLFIINKLLPVPGQKYLTVLSSKENVQCNSSVWKIADIINTLGEHIKHVNSLKNDFCQNILTIFGYYIILILLDDKNYHDIIKEIHFDPDFIDLYNLIPLNGDIYSKDDEMITSKIVMFFGIFTFYLKQSLDIIMNVQKFVTSHERMGVTTVLFVTNARQIFEHTRDTEF